MTEEVRPPAPEARPEGSSDECWRELRSLIQKHVPDNEREAFFKVLAKLDKSNARSASSQLGTATANSTGASLKASLLAGKKALPFLDGLLKSKSKAPPPAGGGSKAPPPKAPPPGKRPPVGKAPARSTAKVPPQLIPEFPQPEGFVPKGISWQGIRDTEGTCWAAMFPPKVGDDRNATTGSSISLSMPSGGDGQNGPEKGTIRMDLDLVNSLFFENSADVEAKKLSAKASASNESSKQVRLLDPKRINAVEIGLKRLHIGTEFHLLRSAVEKVTTRSLDAEPEPAENDPSTPRAGTVTSWVLTNDRAEAILEFWPSPDEAATLRPYLKGGYSSLPTAERFLVTLLSVPIMEKLCRHIVTRNVFLKTSDELPYKIERLTAGACDVLASLAPGRWLFCTLALAVKIGNYVNAGTRRSLVPGLQSSSIENLKGIRSLDGKTTFPRVLVEHLNQYGEAWVAEFDRIASAHDATELILPSEAQKALTALKARLSALVADVDAAGSQSANESEKTSAKQSETVATHNGEPELVLINNPIVLVRALGAFSLACEGSLLVIEIQLSQCCEKLKALAGLLGEPTNDANEALLVLKRVCVLARDLTWAHREAQAEAQAELKKKMRMASRAQTPSARSRGATPTPGRTGDSLAGDPPEAPLRSPRPLTKADSLRFGDKQTDCFTPRSSPRLRSSRSQLPCTDRPPPATVRLESDHRGRLADAAVPGRDISMREWGATREWAATDSEPRRKPEDARESRLTYSTSTAPEAVRSRDARIDSSLVRARGKTPVGPRTPSSRGVPVEPLSARESSVYQRHPWPAQQLIQPGATQNLGPSFGPPHFPPQSTPLQPQTSRFQQYTQHYWQP